MRLYAMVVGLGYVGLEVGMAGRENAWKGKKEC
jgi:hypothetical protein